MCLRVSNAPGPYLARTLVPPPVHSVSVQTSECQHRDNVNPQVWSLQRVECEDPPRPGDTILDMDSAKKNRRRSAPASTSPAVTSLNTTKSPAPALAIKRSDTAPVTLRGWLYKQGSDGLQLWKKRWFVLSEYCLFYYKGKSLSVMIG